MFSVPVDMLPLLQNYLNQVALQSSAPKLLYLGTCHSRQSVINK